MKIYVIRHGETNLNVKRIVQGWLDEPLNENGRRLAASAGQHMRQIRFDACVSSPLIRARETAEILLRESGNDIPVETDDRLKEIHFGDLEGFAPTPADAPKLRQFFGDPFSCPRFPNGETVREVCARTQEFLRELAGRDDGKTYLVSTHGCSLRAMLNPLYADPADFWHGYVPPNCSVSVIEAREGRMELTGDDLILYEISDVIDG